MEAVGTPELTRTFQNWWILWEFRGSFWVHLSSLRRVGLSNLNPCHEMEYDGIAHNYLATSCYNLQHFAMTCFAQFDAHINGRHRKSLESVTTCRNMSKPDPSSRAFSPQIPYVPTLKAQDWHCQYSPIITKSWLSMTPLWSPLITVKVAPAWQGPWPVENGSARFDEDLDFPLAVGRAPWWFRYWHPGSAEARILLLSPSGRASPSTQHAARPMRHSCPTCPSLPFEASLGCLVACSHTWATKGFKCHEVTWGISR